MNEKNKILTERDFELSDEVTGHEGNWFLATEEYHLGDPYYVWDMHPGYDAGMPKGYDMGEGKGVICLDGSNYDEESKYGKLPQPLPPIHYNIPLG